MQRLLIAACFLFCTLNCFAQNLVNDSTVQVVAYWKKGDKARFSVTKTSIKQNGAQVDSKDSVSNIAQLEIIAASEQSYTISWKFLKSNQAIKFDKESSFSKASWLSFNQHFQYKTTELGEFSELINWKQVQANAYNTIDKIVSELKNTPTSAMLNSSKKIFSTKEGIEEVIMKDIQSYHNLYGGAFTLGQKLSAPITVPNFLGGDPFPATLSVELTGIYPDQGYCTFTVNQELDKEKVTEAINRWAEKSGKPKDVKIPSINITDTQQYKMDLKSGWMLELKTHRLVKSDDTALIETLLIKWVE